MLTPEDIVTFKDGEPPEGGTPFVDGPPSAQPIAIVVCDPAWPDVFTQLAKRIRDALGDMVLDIEHVGSTSVPGLPAKPIIDIDLTVLNSADESAWLPQLEAEGFVLKIREPWWYEHRCLKHLDPACNLHVFSPNCPETVRHKMFRDWLTNTPADLALYRDAKMAAAEATNAEGVTVHAYNLNKQQVIREIYQRAFKAAGLL